MAMMAEALRMIDDADVVAVDAVDERFVDPTRVISPPVGRTFVKRNASDWA